jgi:hypothetical protein
MPALFAFGYAAENKLNHSMQQMAQEADHSKEMAVYTTVNREDIRNTHRTDPLKAESQLTELYRQSVEQSGVCVVPNLQLWHKAANYWQENPFKILAGLGGTFLTQYTWLTFTIISLMISLALVVTSSHGGVHFLWKSGTRAHSLSAQGDAHSCLWTVCSHWNAAGPHGIQGIHGSQWKIH